MTGCFTVHPFNALLDNEEGGLSQGHLASPLFTENLLVALQKLEAVFAESDRDYLVAGFFLRIDIMVDKLSYIDVRCLRKRSSKAD